MIITFLLQVAYTFINTLLRVLPNSSGLPSGMHDALTYIIGGINSFSYIIPVAALFAALGTVVLYEAGVWGFHAVMWVWKRLPFIGR